MIRTPPKPDAARGLVYEDVYRYRLSDVMTTNADGVAELRAMDVLTVVSSSVLVEAVTVAVAFAVTTVVAAAITVVYTVVFCEGDRVPIIARAC